MKNYDLNQKHVAKLIGITSTAICQYLSDKRGYYNITDDDILYEIEKSTNILYNNGVECLANENYYICNIIKSKGIVQKIENKQLEVI